MTYNYDLIENSDDTMKHDTLLPVNFLKIHLSTLTSSILLAYDLNIVSPDLL